MAKFSETRHISDLINMSCKVNKEDRNLTHLFEKFWVAAS